ncbi:pyrroline-5-carboxylate reductase [Thermodesulfobacterium sp. TA1]|uniref:pyrroline-5-carboxylate reductase n=1 Tax=Thermodesulfobacterium sp. TA1 TaxID=2234087 RepID=UPI0012327B7C|nr:pyrroline-5-carboxylate reductase [Thermodesulfobacterium sp. TA1]QER42482.1 pyrroline-5-carboxylate reductase [Thermodesulfobacterium sp. TA1]
MANIGFIGGGMMAEAIIKGFLDKGLFNPDNILVSEPVLERREYLSSTYRVKTVEQNGKVLEDCQQIILAVKPQVMKKVLTEIKEEIDPKKHLLITIAAGLPIRFYENILPKGARLIRVMPNTCAVVHQSISALAKGSFATDEDLKTAEKLFSAIGETVIVGEELLDAVTALSGSGPAYVALFVEALIDGGVRAGLPRPLAEKLALATITGSVEMMRKLKKNPYEIKAMVTSPAGTTITALEVLYQQGFPGTVISAVYEAYLRSKELSEAFS